MAEITMEPQMGLDFEQVWAALMELRESGKETDRQMKESHAETDKEIKALSKNIGGLNNSLGKLIDEMFSARLWDKFDSLGYEFTKGGNAKFIENKRIIAETDVFLENGEYAMPVEVKTHLTKEDVDEHTERIGLIRGYMDRRRLAETVVGELCPIA
ncbi:MAG: hypothetical protein LBH85_05590 [Treponema sp.]|jgi:hypothetical protein|nr:hypothetical protein [Treponema sp.]